MQIQRYPMKIRHMMGWVAPVAIFCGLWVSTRVHLQGWEFRRTQMYLQRDVTQTIFSETIADIAASHTKESEIPNVFPTVSRTAEWSIIARKFYDDGHRQGPDRVKVSGANGEFALKPITIEIYDPVLEGPLLRRLNKVYREKGWRYDIVSPPDAKPPGKGKSA